MIVTYVFIVYLFFIVKNTEIIKIMIVVNLTLRYKYMYVMVHMYMCTYTCNYVTYTQCMYMCMYMYVYLGTVYKYMYIYNYCRLGNFSLLIKFRCYFDLWKWMSLNYFLIRINMVCEYGIFCEMFMARRVIPIIAFHGV